MHPKNLLLEERPEHLLEALPCLLPLQFAIMPLLVLPILPLDDGPPLPLGEGPPGVSFEPPGIYFCGCHHVGFRRQLLVVQPGLLV